MLLHKKFEDPWTAQEGHWCSYRVLTKIRKIKLLLRTKNAVGPALTARKASLKVGRLPISGVGFSSPIFFLLRKVLLLLLRSFFFHSSSSSKILSLFVFAFQTVHHLLG